MQAATRFLALAALTAAVGLSTASTAEAFWGHRRVVTSYSVPSVPVATPVVAAPVASAPVVVSRPVVTAAPVTTYYFTPTTRAAYVAPPATTYVAPTTTYYTPTTTYYAPAATVVSPAPVVSQTVVQRPTILGTGVRTTYYPPTVVYPPAVVVP